ncbi:VOC family protein [Cryobacterium sp. 10C3]|uniref:VOC family protein n=1 Tax=Cryobacterium sp. 10C3 TaxID=3048577 RepID=UPI002AB4AE6D|nr:VOC family protein [Cryobacterium sp. 10C3]MDY7557386.1 VOC family protein [Cryobacterium sp. 10C3]
MTLTTDLTGSRAATGDLLAATTGMDAVTLRVGDLALMSSYYREALALDPISAQGTTVVLGRGTTPLVVLEHTPGLPVPARSQAGLFHTAILFDTSAGLAATVLQAARDQRSSFVGSADHIVSNAFYFTDPEGNGIELYVDRDRSEWVYKNGQVQMDTLALDPSAFLQKNLPADGENWPSVRPRSAMFTSRSVTSRWPGASTSTPSASKRPSTSPARCS